MICKDIINIIEQKYDKAYALLADTHGLFIQIKKKLFRGEYLKQPSWISGLSENAKKTAVFGECGIV